MNPEQCQQMLCELTDDPMKYRRPPMFDLLAACHSAKYGDGDTGRDYLTCPF